MRASCFIKCSILLFIFPLIFFSLPMSPALAHQPAATGAMKKATMVPVAPAAIARPVQLKKIQTPGPSDPVRPVTGSPVSMMTAGEIKSCELIAVKGMEVTLSLSYRLNQTIQGPVYTGAFLYDASNQAVNAGYKPASLNQMPAGKAAITLVLPKTAFQSASVEAFLIKNGKIIVRQRFQLAYTWNGHTGAVVKQAAPAPTAVKNKTAFCRAYAQEAVSLYRFGKTNQAPGTTGPGWSDDLIGHYQWCLDAPENVAVQESRRRKAHLRQHLSPGTPGLSDLLKNELDPGLGP